MTDPPFQAISKRSSDSALMPPPPAPKRQKRPPKVLDEDVYSDALSHIIARDFFPGLLETEAQQEYMQALDSNNHLWIREAGKRLTQVMTPGPDQRSRRARATGFTPRRSTALGDTPRGWKGDTPAGTPKQQANDDFAPEPRQEVDVNMSLTAFQAKYTSEDNESFNALLDTQNETRAAKYEFFHQGNKIPSARQIAYRTREQKLLEAGPSSVSSTLPTTNAAGEERKAVAPFARPSQDLSARPASLDSFPNRQGARNHFVFGPDGIENQLPTYAEDAAARSAAPPKSVAYSATRFQPPSIARTDSQIPPSPSMSAIDAAISRRPPKPTASEPGYTGASTPRVNGYAFVDAEPTPSEEAMGTSITNAEAEASGRAAALALLPKADEGGPNPFRISEGSRREGVHRRLVEKADEGRRKGGGAIEGLRRLGVVSTPGQTPTATPSFASARAIKGKAGATMTPAGRMLAASLGKTPGREVEGGFDGVGNSERWTLTPKVKR
ncbi:hypothetical protein B0A50_06865 [Salinomyces thailandicus]|uniref:Uncharacterized protein n=1 Tax=Salinomyces thailandicus TaxID=706561 RepID=A0A4U0TQU2_9PEZI|nr:hypothetical protein B0A50_06865 [Salinomyces thailandica]